MAQNKQDAAVTSAAEKVVDAAADAIKNAAAAQDVSEPEPAKEPTGKPKSYTSSEATYVGGKYYKAGEPFVTNRPKGENWTEITDAERAAAEATNKLGAGDPPLESMDLSALQALAATKNVRSDGLSKAKLIDAIKAANEPRL